MAAEVSDEQRQQVRTALREAGAEKETVNEIEAGDLDVLFLNGWKSKGLILNAQREDLLGAGVSRAAAGVIVRLQEGEPSFLTCFCSWESCHAWQSLNNKSWTFLEAIKRAPCIPI